MTVVMLGFLWLSIRCSEALHSLLLCNLSDKADSRRDTDHHAILTLVEFRTERGTHHWSAILTGLFGRTLLQ